MERTKFLLIDDELINVSGGYGNTTQDAIYLFLLAILNYCTYTSVEELRATNIPKRISEWLSYKNTNPQLYQAYRTALIQLGVDVNAIESDPEVMKQYRNINTAIINPLS